MRFRLHAIIIAMLVATLASTVSAGERDDFYYGLSAAIDILASNTKVCIQLDSTTSLLEWSNILASHPTLDNQGSQEQLPRGFWVVDLHPDSNLDAAIADLGSDSAVNRAIPVYLSPIDSSEFFVTDGVTVCFNDDLDAKTALDLLTTNGLRFVDSSKYKHNLWYCALHDSILTSPISYANALHVTPGVTWATASMIHNASLNSGPTDPYFASQYYLENTGQTGGTEDVDIDADSAWLVTLRNPSVLVAILDDGFTAHPEFESARVLPGYDFAGDLWLMETPDSDRTPSLYTAHGMACAGIIGASHNGLGIAGVVGSVVILPVKIFDDATTHIATDRFVAEAIRYAAASGAKVINCSWNYSWPTEIPDIASAIRDAVASDPPERNYGCVFVFSSGNLGDIVHHEHPPFPANMPEVLTVGAIDKHDDHWYYSSWGPELDVVAPSGDRGASLPRELGDMWTVDQIAGLGYNPTLTGPYDTPDQDYISRFGGTSGAAPQVVGIAALILARRPDLLSDTTYRTIRRIIDSSAFDIGPAGYDEENGFGRANALRALLSVMHGDINNDAFLDSIDISLLIDFVFFGGVHPSTLHETLLDVNCDFFIDSVDLSAIIDIIFFGAEMPPVCVQWMWNIGL